tara:strand:+ start:4340 stop:4723 length:384 start_codon:yes stop_codon:yes gene_type:complete
MEWEFPISPVAASRPRVSRHGAYFTGPYKEFRKVMTDLVPTMIGDMDPIAYPLHVDLEIYVKRPKKTKLDAPRGDIDNYIKAIFDSMNGLLWDDDVQVRCVYATKQWASEGEDGYFVIGVDKYDDSD